MKRKKTEEYNIEKYSTKHVISSNFYHILLPVCARQFYKNFLTLRFITIGLTCCYTATTNHWHLCLQISTFLNQSRRSIDHGVFCWSIKISGRFLYDLSLRKGGNHVLILSTNGSNVYIIHCETTNFYREIFKDYKSMESCMFILLKYFNNSVISELNVW